MFKTLSKPIYILLKYFKWTIIGNSTNYTEEPVIIFKQKTFDSFFISYSQNSSLAKYQKYNSAKGEIIVHTYGSKLRDVFMPFPPSLKEQTEIVQYINKECQMIDLAISKAQKEISSIKEYREALITDLVTGKRSIAQ